MNTYSKRLLTTLALTTLAFSAHAQFQGLLSDLKAIAGSIKQPQASTAEPAPVQAPSIPESAPAKSQATSPTVQISKEPVSKPDLPSTTKKDVVPPVAGVFNLKGFNLNMTRAEVMRLIPNAKLNKQDTIEEKDWFDIQCGVFVQQSPSACGFTYAGQQVTAIAVTFWGNRVIEVEFCYGPYRQQDHNASNAVIDRTMREALDAKYPKESNTSGPGGNLGTQWESGSEFLKTNVVESGGLISNSISLKDMAYLDQFADASSKYFSAKQKKDQAEKIKKVTSDM